MDLAYTYNELRIINRYIKQQNDLAIFLDGCLLQDVPGVITLEAGMS